MKLRRTISFIICLIMCSLPATIFANENIKVVIEGSEIIFEQPPIIENGRTLVPMREVFEALGMDVQYIPDSKTIIATNENRTIKMKVNDTSFQCSSSFDKSFFIEYFFDVPPKIINGKTMIPVGFVFKAIDFDVTWDDKTKTVHISNSQKEDNSVSESKIFYNEYPTIPRFENVSPTLKIEHSSDTTISLLSPPKTSYGYFYNNLNSKQDVEKFMSDYSNLLQKSNWKLLRAKRTEVTENGLMEYHLSSPDNKYRIEIHGDYPIDNPNVYYSIVTIYTYSKSPVKMYTGYEIVPDFGAFFNIKPITSKSEGENIVYIYDPAMVDYNTLNDYYFLLMDYGFDTPLSYADFVAKKSLALFTDDKNETMLVVGIEDNGYFMVGISGL